MELPEALRRTARSWQDPAHAARAEAVARTLGSEGLLTPESLAFGLNVRMQALAEGWVPSSRPSRPRQVGVPASQSGPLATLDEMLAVLLTGHHFLGAERVEAVIAAAFASSLETLVPGLPVAFLSDTALLRRAEVLVLEEAGDTTLPQFVRPECFGVAVLDGREREDERERLAEDVMLFEGATPRNVKIVWAPSDLPPDAYLESFAHFRVVFPAPSALAGRLALPAAFLRRGKVPHAELEDHSLLVSRGDPEPQTPGHLRWCPYRTEEEVTAWLSTNRHRLSFVAAREALRARVLGEGGGPLGEAHRVTRAWRPGGEPLWRFLETL